ncbi:hypothetical protein JVU11DRAFT_2081 [Chiua virens]|nr:hypothetical protein JVU11DRAFT_2081 [Chiua virens]
MTDIAVLAQARRQNIPAYLVCSKADYHIHSIMSEMGYHGEGKEEDVEHRNELYEAAREHFVETRKARETLEEAKLPDQHLYTVSSTMLNKNPEGTIDEADRLKDLGDQT